MVGARPNFVKAAPVMCDLWGRAQQMLVHTGQFHDAAMSAIFFFAELDLAAAVEVAESGGVQEETTWLGVPCLTVRDSTERPVTRDSGDEPPSWIKL